MAVVGRLREQQRRLDLYLTNRSALIDFAAPIVGDRARAEDVVQEAWLRFGGTAPVERGSVAQPLSYLYRIVRNLAIDLSRRSGREMRGPDVETILEQTPDSQPGPDAQLAGREQIGLVVAALGGLSERTRRAFHLHRFEGKTYAEIARTLGVSQGTAHNLVSEAVAVCLQRLMDDDA